MRLAYQAPAGCPDADAFTAEVRARAPRSSALGGRSVDVTVSSTSSTTISSVEREGAQPKRRACAAGAAPAPGEPTRDAVPAQPSQLSRHQRLRQPDLLGEPAVGAGRRALPPSGRPAVSRSGGLRRDHRRAFAAPPFGGARRAGLDAHPRQGPGALRLHRDRPPHDPVGDASRRAAGSDRGERRRIRSTVETETPRASTSSTRARTRSPCRSTAPAPTASATRRAGRRAPSAGPAPAPRSRPAARPIRASVSWKWRGPSARAPSCRRRARSTPPRPRPAILSLPIALRWASSETAWPSRSRPNSGRPAPRESLSPPARRGP